MNFEQWTEVVEKSLGLLQTLGIGGIGWALVFVLYKELRLARAKIFELQDEQRKNALERARFLEERMLEIQTSKALHG